MSDFPRSLIEFQQRFADEAACVEYLFAARWPAGFMCPGCGSSKAWELQTKAWTWECASCGKQTSVTAGTIMHHSKLALTTWFWAAYLMATHSNGISALQLQRQLALGSYKTAWLMCAKLRRSMVAPDRSPLAGLVEVDETEIACRSKHDPVTGGGGRSHQGKMLVVGAVEVEDGGAGPGRIRLAEVPDYSANSLHPFVARNLAAGTTAKTDGWSAYPGAPGVGHDPRVIGKIGRRALRRDARAADMVRRSAQASLSRTAAGIVRILRAPGREMPESHANLEGTPVDRQDRTRHRSAS